MKNLKLYKSLMLFLDVNNETRIIRYSLTLLPWIGLIICLGIIFFDEERVTPANALIPTLAAPELEVTINDVPDPVKIGQTLTYTLTVSNTGTALATNVVMTAQLDEEHLEFISASGGGSDNNGDITWNIDVLAAGATLDFTLVVQVTSVPYKLLPLTVNIESEEGALACEAETTLVTAPELVLQKQANPETAQLGESLTYTVVVTNIGTADATEVIITDDLSDKVTFASASDGGSHDGINPNGTVTWPPLSSLPPGGVISRTVSVTVSDDNALCDPIPNTAQVTAAEGVTATDTITTPIGAGQVTVHACADVDADGVCDAAESLPSGVQACLVDADDQTSCQPTPATFDVGSGVFTASLSFTGASQGYYPTTPSQQVEVAVCENEEVTLSAVYPTHPKGIAIHQPSNKIYAAFQGPKVDGLPEEDSWPYPFVAVIDGETEQVLQTIPGTDDGLGRQPWGVAAANDYVYVGSFRDGRISVIDVDSDTVIYNITPNRSDFKPIGVFVNPANNRVHFADYEGGRAVIINGLSIVAEPVIHNTPASFSPFEIGVAHNHSFVTMRDSLPSNKYKLAHFSGTGGGVGYVDIDLPDTRTGPPHALGVWSTTGSSEGHVFVTVADDPRPPFPEIAFPNPNKLIIYSFPTTQPENLSQLAVKSLSGDYAEAGLVYHPQFNRMVGAYGGFAYKGHLGDQAACAPDERGALYTLDFNGNEGTELHPTGMVGNPGLTGTNLAWDNPFEIAVAESGKIYVTDRCWSDTSTEEKAGYGAILIYDPNLTQQVSQPDEQFLPVVKK